MADPLPPVQGEADSLKPVGGSNAEEDTAGKPAAKTVEEAVPIQGTRTVWLLVLMALVTLLVGVAIGFALK